MPSCAIGACSNHNKKTKSTGVPVMYHRFPKDRETSDRWVHACRRGDEINLRNATVCSVHFTDKDYIRDLKALLLGLPPKRLLKPNAVPTLHLLKTDTEENDVGVETTPSQQVYYKGKKIKEKKVRRPIEHFKDHNYAGEPREIQVLPQNRILKPNAVPTLHLSEMYSSALRPTGDESVDAESSPSQQEKGNHRTRKRFRKTIYSHSSKMDSTVKCKRPEQDFEKREFQIKVCRMEKRIKQLESQATKLKLKNSLLQQNLDEAKNELKCIQHKFTSSVKAEVSYILGGLLTKAQIECLLKDRKQSSKRKKVKLK